MGNIFQNDVSILIDKTPIGTEFHLYEVGYEECRPTKPYEFAPINYWVIHYCIAGEGIFSVAGVEHRITPGDLFMIPAHIRNRYYPDSNHPWSYRWIGLSGSLVEAILKPCGLTRQNCVLHNDFNPHLEALFEKTYLHFKSHETYAALGNVFSLLDYLVQNTKPENAPALSSKELHFHTVLKYIHNNYFNNLTIEELAGVCNIDRSYLFKLFKTYKNMSPSQYIQQYRLEQSCALLRKSSLSITDISYAVGFQYPSYFSKLFAEYKGMTPLQYRNSLMKIGDK